MNRIPELLAPAGNREKLEVALHYGADAVYMGGQKFSLRNFSENFSPTEMKSAIAYTHNMGRKAYITINIYLRDFEKEEMKAYLKEVASFFPDAFIIADPAVFTLAQEVAPHIPIHISTQANVTSSQAARFWAHLGATRINTARELNLSEIEEIVRSGNIKVEAFAHGSMCVSYSGRCLLSSFMVGRDSNRGECSHPCRWQYHVMEEKRPGEYYPVMEDERGTYIFNSHDLSMLEHLPQMIKTGLHSLKIEGRMKSVHYVGSIVRTYRLALDAYALAPLAYKLDPVGLSEIDLVSRHGLGTGFYLGMAKDSEILRDSSARPVQQYFLGRVDMAEKTLVSLTAKNNIAMGDSIIRLTPHGSLEEDTIIGLWNKNSSLIETAHPNDYVRIQFKSIQPEINDLLRKATE